MKRNKPGIKRLEWRLLNNFVEIRVSATLKQSGSKVVSENNLVQLQESKIFFFLNTMTYLTLALFLGN